MSNVLGLVAVSSVAGLISALGSAIAAVAAIWALARTKTIKRNTTPSNGKTMAAMVEETHHIAQDKLDGGTEDDHWQAPLPPSGGGGEGLRRATVAVTSWITPKRFKSPGPRRSEGFGSVPPAPIR